MALLGTCDAIQDSEAAILAAILGFTQNKKLSKKRGNLKLSHVEYDKIKLFVAIC